MPIHGAWYDYCGVSYTARRAYYEKLRGISARYHVPVVDFADHAMIYEIKYCMGNHSRINETNDSVRTNVLYELKRQDITIPFPIRTLHV